MPSVSRVMPIDVRVNPRRLCGSGCCGVILYGIMRNQSGFCMVVTVSSKPPVKNIEPMVARKYPTVSLCLDSSAFSCRCSLRSM